MEYLHPALSGMPLSFILLLGILEVARIVPIWRHGAEAARGPVVIACTLGAVAAFLSGYHASSLLHDLPPLTEDALGSHHAWGRMMLIAVVVVATLFWIAKIATHGRATFVALYYAALVSLIALTAWAGHLGGELVFEHNIQASSYFSRSSLRAP